jgi:TolB-like protein
MFMSYRIQTCNPFPFFSAVLFHGNKLILFFLLFFSISVAQQGKPTVAILDFEGQGVDASEVQTLTERMRTEIGNTKAVRLIERKAVEKIMQEQGLQQSGCTSDECAAEVGQLLGVQFMISGSIGKMGKSYTIDAKMFSVESGETVRTQNATHDGDISGLLTEMEILAWEIVGLQAPGSLKLKRAGTDATRTVAVLDFEGRGITREEAQTLTDRFTTSLASTEKVVMVERGTMVDVLEEQGFEAGECASDECAAEVGAMLGVEYMISGAIGKLGDTYTIDAKMFSVATGAAESMKNITYSGKVDGLIVEIEILAWNILGLDPPRALKKKRKKGAADVAEDKGGTNWLLWGLVGIVAAGGGAYVATAGGGGDVSAGSAIGEPPGLPEVP